MRNLSFLKVPFTVKVPTVIQQNTENEPSPHMIGKLQQEGQSRNRSGNELVTSNLEMGVEDEAIWVLSGVSISMEEAHPRLSEPLIVSLHFISLTLEKNGMQKAKWGRGKTDKEEDDRLSRRERENLWRFSRRDKPLLWTRLDPTFWCPHNHKTTTLHYTAPSCFPSSIICNFLSPATVPSFPSDFIREIIYIYKKKRNFFPLSFPSLESVTADGGSFNFLAQKRTEQSNTSKVMLTVSHCSVLFLLFMVTYPVSCLWFSLRKKNVHCNCKLQREEKVKIFPHWLSNQLLSFTTLRRPQTALFFGCMEGRSFILPSEIRMRTPWLPPCQTSPIRWLGSHYCSDLEA